MADRWMDERDRRWRDRDWRRSEDTGRSDLGGEDYYGARSGGEDRSFGGEEQEFGARRSGPGRDRVFGEEETGASYNRGVTPGGGGYGAGGSYGGGESYGRGAGGGQDYRSRQSSYGGMSSSRWQERDYGGVSPAMEQGEYDAERGRTGGGRSGLRFGSQDYTQGGRFYGDDDRAPIYREEYGQGGVEYGKVPGGYDAGRDRGYGGPSGGRYGGTYGGAGGDYGYQVRPAYGGTASGGTGGYDFERGYGDGGRRDFRQGDMDRHPDADRWQARGGEAVDRAGDFISRAGRRVANWFRGDDLMDDGDGSYRTDFGRERRYMDRGHRGLGPKGYKRSDERIAEEANQRLTDDEWLDASNIDVHVANGEVTLTGTVENRQAKHRAEHAVEDISGVNHVQNNLRIDRGQNILTGAGRGYGDSVLEKQMMDHDPAALGSGGAASANGDGQGTEDTAATRTTTRRT